MKRLNLEESMYMIHTDHIYLRLIILFKFYSFHSFAMLFIE